MKIHHSLEIEPEDWDRINKLKNSFEKICDGMNCGECPMNQFCHDHEEPSYFLDALTIFLTTS